MRTYTVGNATVDVDSMGNAKLRAVGAHRGWVYVTVGTVREGLASPVPAPYRPGTSLVTPLPRHFDLESEAVAHLLVTFLSSHNVVPFDMNTCGSVSSWKMAG